MLHYFLSFPWLGMETYGSKISFYCNIFLSFYRNMSRVNKALINLPGNEHRSTPFAATQDEESTHEESYSQFF
jgi:hypothetical protein